MIDGLSHLITLRKQGLRPVSVWLSIGVPYRKPKYSGDYVSMELVAHDCVKRDDFRAFKNLNVLFYVPKWNPLATECFERLKLHANEITMLSPEYGEDIGFLWSREYGQMDMGVIGWIEQYHNARKMLCTTDSETDKRLALEAEALSHVPNIGDYRGDAA